MHRYSYLSIFGLFAIVILAAPTIHSYPEVIPGPGQPSLVDLGVTSAQLYEEGKALLTNHTTTFTNKRTASVAANCYPDYQTNIYDIAAIYAFIHRKGYESNGHNSWMNCGSSKDPIGSWSQLAAAGTAQVLSLTWRGNGWGYSDCLYVAKGIWNIIDGCGDMNDEERLISGVATTYANGDQYLIARNLSYPSSGSGMAWFPIG